jgi:nucleotide-binding universal stress UspA family protein
MYRSILVPLDVSPFGEQALPLACSLARRSGATLQLVHVHVPLKPLILEAISLVDPGTDAHDRAREHAYLERLAQRLTVDWDIHVTAAVLDTPVADALLTHALEARVDLIVMSTHGRGALSRFWLGSVTDQLVRRAPVPVLLVRPREAAADLRQEQEVRHVLMPLDGSPAAEQVLRHALALGRSAQAAHTLLHAIEPLAGEYGTELYAADLGEVAFGQLRSRAETYLERLAAPLRAEGLRVWTTVVLGAAAPAILEYAHKQAVDLIALTSHGHSGVAHMLVGGVADKVLRGASVPLLLYRPDRAR